MDAAKNNERTTECNIVLVFFHFENKLVVAGRISLINPSVNPAKIVS